MYNKNDRVYLLLLLSKHNRFAITEYNTNLVLYVCIFFSGHK